MGCVLPDKPTASCGELFSTWMIKRIMLNEAGYQFLLLLFVDDSPFEPRLLTFISAGFVGAEDPIMSHMIYRGNIRMNNSQNFLKENLWRIRTFPIELILRGRE